MYRYLVLAATLGVCPACLNPDISDEYPLTTQADALELGDAGTATDEALDEARADEPERDESSAADDEPAAGTDDRARPRRSFVRR